MLMRDQKVFELEKLKSEFAKSINFHKIIE